MKIPFFTFLLLFLSCALFAAERYDESANWVLRPPEGSAENTLYDVFYVYPTLVNDKTKPLMDCSDPAVRAKTYGFAKAQTSFFPKARIFAPYVRQLDYSLCLSAINAENNPSDTMLKQGINDTLEAFRHYLKHDNAGRPFILFGHSQGSIELYEVLRQVKEISPERGFIAAYLPGLRLSKEKFRKDFDARPIRSGEDSDACGVVLVWNTVPPDSGKEMFSVPDGVCVNPVNWKTSEAPATAGENPGAVFYDYRNPDKPLERIAHFCGAKINASRGALEVVPPDRKYKSYPGMGYHMYDVWFFAQSIGKNALHRVELRMSNTKK